MMQGRCIEGLEVAMRQVNRVQGKINLYSY